jgi:hypothetical protein
MVGATMPVVGAAACFFSPEREPKEDEEPAVGVPAGRKLGGAEAAEGVCARDAEVGVVEGGAEVGVRGTDTDGPPSEAVNLI